MRRSGLVGAALVALASAVIVIADPALVAEFSVDDVFVYLLGFGMILLGFIRAYRGRHRHRQAFEPDEPESFGDVDPLGEGLDTAWDDFRFETIAIQILTRTEGCSDAEARRMLEAGTWTDDATAAAYFTADGLPERELSAERAQEWLADATAIQRTRALEALAELVHLDTGGDDE